jgi:predicted RNase H-like nuclease (RuvC/YqgF family)
MGSPFNPTTMSPPPLPQKDTTAPTPIDVTLLNELERERALRAKAEARAQKVDSEIEELSVQLFSQANEMVAEERRARAKLEERIEVLEKKDRDKMARLERLEKAVSRIDRVKAMLNSPVTGATLAPPAKR